MPPLYYVKNTVNKKSPLFRKIDMKHLNRVYAQIIARGVPAGVPVVESHTPFCPPEEGAKEIGIAQEDDTPTQLEEGEAVAQEGGLVAQPENPVPSLGDTPSMEGLVDNLKAGWEAFKHSVKPTDHTAILQKIGFIPAMKKSVAEMKSALSRTKDADFALKPIGHVSRILPVSANSAEELIRELGGLRKRISAISAKIAQTSDEKEVKRYRQELAMEFSKRGNVSDKITFSRPNALKFCNEIDLFLDVFSSLGKEYTHAHDKIAAEGGKVATEGLAMVIAMEGHEDALDIALESAGSIIVGTVVLMGAIILRMAAYFATFAAFLSLMSGVIPAAVIGGAAAYILFWASNRGLQKAEDMLFED